LGEGGERALGVGFLERAAAVGCEEDRETVNAGEEEDDAEVDGERVSGFKWGRW
jgi:hypothetical protein